ncbi:MAG: hypothetical protein GEU79_13555 [Acidimicrobiia bacterium]|nr:hypothetical protein [Acidimicrobiia bacterium]
MSILDLNTGYSLGMGALGIMVAALAILVGRKAPSLIGHGAAFSLVCLPRRCQFSLWQRSTSPKQ